MTFVRFHRVLSRQRRDLVLDTLITVSLTSAVALSTAALSAAIR